MSFHEFARKITQGEGLKDEVNIAQVKEILAVINRIIPFNLFYTLIKLIPK